MLVTERSFQFHLLARKQKHKQMLGIFLVALPVIFFVALNTGAVPVDLFSVLTSIDGSLNQQQGLQSTIIFDIRLPRVLMTMVTGAGLAVSGLVLQSIFRNPLADPGLIGVSSFAALFAALGFLLSAWVLVPSNILPYFIPTMAFSGAVISVFLLFAIAGRRRQLNTSILILVGVAINAGAMTLLGIITFLVDDSTLRQITFWSMGSYAGTSSTVMMITAIIVCIGLLMLWREKNALMLMAVGEKQARFQGVDTEQVKTRCLVIVAGVVAVCVSFTGIVGFVGLVVPHICRMLASNHLRVLLPLTAMCGAMLVALADMLARTIMIPSELPVGLVTSLIGVPFFVMLIYQEKRKQGYV
ncbi:FecCD family ABC transporter permease [Agaribacter flavus]|uniref:FecCD family ABC transporter permease n=1 Tax=Agaribacter flavus TaxID=1902781 RepID=A0ABV7FR73_9ALTE